jgi:hypothetical protein
MESQYGVMYPEFYRTLSESLNEGVNYKKGYHLIAAGTWEERQKWPKSIKNPSTIVVIGGPTYIQTIKQSNKFSVIKAFAEKVNAAVNGTIVYNADTQEFSFGRDLQDSDEFVPAREQLLKRGMLDQHIDGNLTFDIRGFQRTGGFELSKIKREIEIASTGHVNDYEAIGSKIIK